MYQDTSENCFEVTECDRTEDLIDIRSLRKTVFYYRLITMIGFVVASFLMLKHSVMPYSVYVDIYTVIWYLLLALIMCDLVFSEA